MIMRRVTVPALLLLLAVRGALASEGSPLFRQVRHLFVKVDVLGVRPGGSAKLGSTMVEAAPDRPGRAIIPLSFAVGEGLRVSGLEIGIDQRPDGEGGLRFEVTTTAR